MPRKLVPRPLLVQLMTGKQVWLAKAEKELGLRVISDEAISQMEKHVTVQDDEFPVIAEEEKRRRHDVMAHVSHISPIPIDG